ncbi:MAG: hypothetical protein Q9162_000838, partial [Coniocarpon cinnabarinum]
MSAQAAPAPQQPLPAQTRPRGTSTASPSSATKRNEECSYAPDARPVNAPGDARRSVQKANVQDRVKHLEALVISLMQERDQHQRDGPSVQPNASSASVNSRTPPYRPDYAPINGGSPTSERSNLSQTSDSAKSATHIVPLHSSGRILNREGEAGYVGPEHWQTILESLADVREFLVDDDSPDISPDIMDIVPRTEEPYLLMPHPQMFDRMEILSSMPDKPDCDQLVYRYISTVGPTRVMIHGPTFIKEYEEFWQNSDSATNTWLGLLFGIMCLAVGFHRRRREPLPPSLQEIGDVASIYRVRSAQCLINANYAKITKYTLESLVVYSFAEFLRSKDVPVTTGLIVEMAISMAIRAGFHRDPSHFGNRFTPFEKEMRRRIWSNLVISDISMSFDNGKPRAIHSQYVDTQIPGNYAEEDFDESTQEMPPERQDDEPTNISFTRSKLRVVYAFSSIYDATQRVTPMSYDEVLQLERNLNEAYALLPSHMHIESREFRNCALSQALIWQYNVGMMYQKARCTLHRPYTFGLDSLERQSYSRDMCQEAAMEILRYQRQLQAHLKPGGALHREWFFSPQEIQDSILAAMLVCRDLTVGIPGSPNNCTAKADDAKERQRRHDQIQALEGTCLLWDQLKNSSGDAYKAYLVVCEVLRKQKPKTEPPPQSFGAKASSYNEINPHLVTNADPSAGRYYDEVMTAPLLPPMQAQQWTYNTYSAPATQVPQMPTAPIAPLHQQQYQYAASMPQDSMW